MRYFTSPRLGFVVDDSYHSSADFMLACVSGKAHSTVYGYVSTTTHQSPLP